MAKPDISENFIVLITSFRKFYRLNNPNAYTVKKTPKIFLLSRKIRNFFAFSSRIPLKTHSLYAKGRKSYSQTHFIFSFIHIWAEILFQIQKIFYCIIKNFKNMDFISILYYYVYSIFRKDHEKNESAEKIIRKIFA